MSNSISLTVNIGRVAINYCNESIDKVRAILQNLMKQCVDPTSSWDYAHLEAVLEYLEKCGAHLEKMSQGYHGGVDITVSFDSEKKANVVRNVYSKSKLVTVN